MFLVAIRQEKSGKNTYFITDDFNQYTLSEILMTRVSLKGVQIIKPKSSSPYIRSIPNSASRDNLEKITITCNDGDYLFFDRKYIYLKALNGRVKKQWEAFSGNKEASIEDQNREDFGPLPEGEYIVHFDRTLDIEDSKSIWDEIKWHIKSLRWGYINTPLEQTTGQTYNRGNFFIHGGIELIGDLNKNFHSFMALYDRSFKLIVKYKK